MYYVLYIQLVTGRCIEFIPLIRFSHSIEAYRTKFCYFFDFGANANMWTGHSSRGKSCWVVSCTISSPERANSTLMYSGHLSGRYNTLNITIEFTKRTNWGKQHLATLLSSLSMVKVQSSEQLSFNTAISRTELSFNELDKTVSQLNLLFHALLVLWHIGGKIGRNQYRSTDRWPTGSKRGHTYCALVWSSIQSKRNVL